MCPRFCIIHIFIKTYEAKLLSFRFIITQLKKKQILNKKNVFEADLNIAYIARRNVSPDLKRIQRSRTRIIISFIKLYK